MLVKGNCLSFFGYIYHLKPCWRLFQDCASGDGKNSYLCEFRWSGFLIKDRLKDADRCKKVVVPATPGACTMPRFSNLFIVSFDGYWVGTLGG